MAKPILVANWKNHPGSALEAKSLLKNLSKRSTLYKKASFFIAPPAPYLGLVAERAKNFARLASQDFPPLSGGTHTGMLTPEILKSFGVRLSIIGHSERRALGETSEEVSEKVKAALRSGIMPLVCVGERERDTDGEHFEFLRDELKASLAGVNARAAAQVMLAYEPEWAIGKSGKDALPPEELSQSIIFLRKVLTDLYGRKTAENIPILYGGAVEAQNAGALMNESSVRGLLIGHASLDAESLEEITKSILVK